MEKKFKFWCSTRYVNSTIEDDVVLDFDDDITEEEIEKQTEECWVAWRNEQCDGGWREL